MVPSGAINLIERRVEAGLGVEQQMLGIEAHASGAQLDLLNRFFGGYVQRRADLIGELGGGLQEQC